MKTTCPKCKSRIRIRNKREIDCTKCGFQFSHRKFYGESTKYLVDTNIFIGALNGFEHHHDACTSVLTLYAGELITTNHVIAEILQYCPHTVKVYIVDAFLPEVEELCYITKDDEDYALSPADKSLIQCAIDNPDIAGIITYDTDIKSVVPSRLIRSEKPFFIGTADDFLKKRGRK